MRSLVIPAAVLAAVVALCLWCGDFVEENTAEWTAALEQTDESAWRENWREASEQLRQVYSRWEARQDLLHVLIAHDELEQAEGLFAGAFAACRESDGPDFHTMLAQLIKALEHLADAQALSLRNIF